MGEEPCRTDGFLWMLKAESASGGQDKDLGLTMETECEWTENGAILKGKAVIEFTESKESLKFFHRFAKGQLQIASTFLSSMATPFSLMM